MKKTIGFALSAVALVAGAGLAISQATQNHGTMDHNTTGHGTMKHDGMENSQNKTSTTGTMPIEPGQGAFATIAEIVVILKNDPATDWSKVNIDGLRKHLKDMDELTLNSKSRATFMPNKISFNITGSARTQQAIKTMVPAHVNFLPKAWNATAKTTVDGTILTIQSNDPATLKKVKAIGFYGVMATGAHHQSHHLAMAKGDKSVHSD
jgi:hypothetical protein